MFETWRRSYAWPPLRRFRGAVDAGAHVDDRDHFYEKWATLGYLKIHRGVIGQRHRPHWSFLLEDG
jgi:hypothetical protein